MTRFSFQTFIFCLTILAQWARGIPLLHTVVYTSEEIVFQLVVITKTTVICPSTATETSSTLLSTTTPTSIGRPQDSLAKDSHVVGSTTPSRQDAGVSMSSVIQGSQTSLLSSLTPTWSSSCGLSSPTPSSEAASTSDSSLSQPLRSAFSTTPTPYSLTISYTNTSSAALSTPPRTVPIPTTTASSTVDQQTPILTTSSMGQSHRTLSSTKPEDNEEPMSSSWKETLRDTLSSFVQTATSTAVTPSDNVFVPIQQDHILDRILVSRHHPVERKGVEDNENTTMHTNKFYANAFLGGQDQPIWTHPYSIWWGKGHTENGVFPTWGMNIAHIEEWEVSMPDGDPAQHYINPRRSSLILTAQELDVSTIMTTDTHRPFSVNINLNQHMSSWEPKITFPVVQGMSFVTGGYRDAAPVIQCPGKGFRNISGPYPVGKSTKYRMTDDNGRAWLAYVNPVAGIDYDPKAFVAIDPNTFLGPKGFKGTIQIAKNPIGDEGEALYDKATGAFVAEAAITAAVNESRGTYSFSYTKVGVSPLLMFVLPHHIQSLDPELSKSVTNLQLHTTTKGMATAVWADKLTLIEPNLPTTMGFGPWTPALGAQKLRFSSPTLDTIKAVAEQDLKTCINGTTPDDSMYYAGKWLAKCATVVWVLKEIVGGDTYVSGLEKLKNETSRYIRNGQKYPLLYDNTWKGLVSNAGFNDPNADFGNTYYNDHHFHYGYFVYAAAVIGFLDPTWLTLGDNKAWVNSLVKDFAESDIKGRDYPFSRAFDFWMGHSWAKGLFESADGKDEESTSEDGFASFALKMWGKVIGDANMEKRGNLMLAIQARAFNTYFYLQPDSTIHPPKFTGNMVTGILFENKVDYATYFGLLPELIHGIHMLPVSPASQYLRPRAFVEQEWAHFFSGDRWLVPGGWRGILMANYALVDPKASWEFFKNGVDGVWNDTWIDGGASRSWYLTWAAGLGGAK